MEEQDLGEVGTDTEEEIKKIWRLFRDIEGLLYTFRIDNFPID